MTTAQSDGPENFDPANAEPDPLSRFARWWTQARGASPFADAMALATASPDGTPSVGPQAIRAAWQPIFDDPSSSFEEEETFAAGDRVVQRWRYRWDSGSIRGVDVFRIRDGKVAEKISYVKG